MDTEKKVMEESKKGPHPDPEVQTGRHFSTMAEANAFWADMGNYPRLANWLAGQAREEEARRLRRSGAKKRKRVENPVAGMVQGSKPNLVPENGVTQIGVVEVAQRRTTQSSIDAVLECEDVKAQEQNVKVIECAQGSSHWVTNAVSESESEVIQHHVDSGSVDIGNTSDFGEITKPTGHTVAVRNLCFSRSEKLQGTVGAPAEGAKINAETDDYIPLMREDEHAENGANFERAVSVEAEHDDREYIIPVKLLRKQAENDAKFERMVSAEAEHDDREDIIPLKLLKKQAENNANFERTVSVEAEHDDREDIIPVKLLRKLAEMDTCLEGKVPSGAEPSHIKDIFPRKRSGAARYFDPQDNGLLTCSWCGEDDHIAANCSYREKKRQKVNKCLFCNKKGHLAKDCPEGEILQEQTSSFCLICANPGHDMFSCTKDYPAVDLQRVQCYICKAFGHLCCTTYENKGPRSVSCYNCGESGHPGSECKKPPEKSSEPKPKRRKNKKKNKKFYKKSSGQNQPVLPDVGEKGHLAQEGNKSEKGENLKELALANVPKPARLPKMKKHAQRFGNGPQGNNGSKFNPPYGLCSL